MISADRHNVSIDHADGSNLVTYNCSLKLAKDVDPSALHVEWTEAGVVIGARHYTIVQWTREERHLDRRKEGLLLEWAGPRPAKVSLTQDDLPWTLKRTESHSMALFGRFVRALAADPRFSVSGGDYSSCLEAPVAAPIPQAPVNAPIPEEATRALNQFLLDQGRRPHRYLGEPAIRVLLLLLTGALLGSLMAWVLLR